MQCPRCCPNSSENVAHGQSRREREEEEDEEGSGFAPEVRDEVDDKVEWYRNENFRRQVNEHRTEGLCRRVIESICRVFFDLVAD